MLNRRSMQKKLMAGAFLGMSGLPCSGVFAQQSGSTGAYPNRPVKIIVPYATGSQTDGNARLIAPKLAQVLGAPIVVENRAGASGIIGSEFVARSTPDGYTLVMGTVTSHGTMISLAKNLPYKLERDFTPIGLVAAPPAFLAVHSSVPASNIKEFVAWAETQPAGVSYSSAGNGSSGHLTAELLAMRTNTRLIQVPYNNAGQAVTDLLAGHVKMMIYYSTLLPHIRSGKLKALAVFAEDRVDFAKEIPTAKEQGFAGMTSYGWSGLFGPGALPGPIRDRLNAALNTALADQSLRQQFADQGQVTMQFSPSEFQKFIAAEVDKWGEVVRVSGAKLD